MRILVLDSALACCTAAIVQNETVVAQRRAIAARGQSSVLPVLLDEVLREAPPRDAPLDLIAVTLGPGSFTGIRGGLALAHGYAMATGIALVGVTVGEALAEALPRLGQRALWIAIAGRRGRVFLGREGRFESRGLDELPVPDRHAAVAVAGDAAIPVAAFLAAREVDVMLTDARLPVARHVALVAARRFAGQLPALAVQPLYVEPPLVTLPAPGTLRPAPV
jgi:tRNA threonylcarbamoyl adenosine modification protein YeaZ